MRRSLVLSVCLLLGAAWSAANAASIEPRGRGPGVFARDLISGKGHHFCAVTFDHHLACWGINYSGQLGINQTLSPNISAYPRLVAGLNGQGTLGGVVSVSAGRDQTCAVLDDGKVACWGARSGNAIGKGVAETGSQLYPSLVQETPGVPLTGIKSVEVGLGYVCALTTQGKVKCWGQNKQGIMGDGSGASDYLIHTVKTLALTELSDVIELRGSQSNAMCALRADGTAWCWGDNTHDRLGHATFNRYTNSEADVLQVAFAVQVNRAGDATRFKTISVGQSTTCGVKTDGRLYCWGLNGSAQNFGAKHLPYEYSGIPTLATDLKRPVKGVSVGSDYVCAILVEGGSHCWGRNLMRQLGRGVPPAGSEAMPVSSNPLQELHSFDVLEMATGFTVACALTTQGRIRCAGKSSEGALGQGTSSVTQLNYAQDIQKQDLTNYREADTGTMVAAGDHHSCILSGNQSLLKCAGANDFGQLGTGAFASSPVYVPVALPASAGPVAGVIAVSAGNQHSCAVTVFGRLYCWGGNGSVGAVKGDGGSNKVDPANPGVAVPYEVPGLREEQGDNAVFPLQVASGGAHNCALMSNGTVRCWGRNDLGQVGNGQVKTALGSPVTEVVGITDAVALGLGDSSSCAILVDGSLRCWGENGLALSTGVAGQGFTPVLLPHLVLGLSNVLQASPGTAHGCALSAGGSLYCWGSDALGQLGFQEGTSSSDQSTPTVRALTAVTGVSAIATGRSTTCAKAEDGALKCWGSHEFSQTGTGSAPGSVQLPTGVVGQLKPLAFSTGSHSLASVPGGTKFGWGRNDAGQLGEGTTGVFTVPVAASPGF